MTREHITGQVNEPIHRDVVQYAEMGDHRTGSQVDLDTSAWIGDRLEASGLSVEFDTLAFRRFEPEACWIGLYGTRFDALPLWHPTAAGCAPLVAQVVMDSAGADVSGKIILVRFETPMVTPKSEHAAIIHRLFRAGAKAIIGCMPHGSGEIFAPNAIPPHNFEPWPVPVALIAPKHWHVLAHAADLGDKVEFVLRGHDQPRAIARNVVARINRGPRWIIVSTPQSGWFRCAGERGAGVALFLELARWAAKSTDDHSFLFLSSTGHEIGHIGIHNILDQGIPPAPGKTDCWLHLGASVATRAFAEKDGVLTPSGAEPDSWLFCSESMMPSLKQAFSAHDHLSPQVYNRNHGEIRWILERGYDAFSLMGPQRFFHLADDGPEVVDPDLLQKTAATLKQTLAGLPKSSSSAA